jgi:thioredoxin reductase (NADPH)
MSEAIKVDAAIIGGGPVGLFAVFALGQLGLGTAVVDALGELGGQCTALYPEKPIYDIPSRPAIDAGDLVQELITQAAPYEPRYVLGSRAEVLDDAGERFRIALSCGRVIDAGAVIVASGAGAFGPNRPPLDGLEDFEGRSVFYAVRSRERFRGKRIVIGGGGDSAVDWAVSLADTAEAVTVVHRRRVFRAAPATVAALERLAAENRIRIAAPGSIDALHGAEGQISAVSLSLDDGARIETLPADALLCFYGLAKDPGPLTGWGIGADRMGIPVAADSMATTRPGVFAIGDAASYAGKLKLILTGFSEAALAAHSARAHLYPSHEFHFEYSTTRGAPRREVIIEGA